MNCRTATQAIALAGDLAPEEAAALASHLLTCARCRAEQEIAALITAALETDREPLPSADFTAQVLDRIRDAEETAPRERIWMPLVPAAALLSSIGAVWVTSALIPWRDTVQALGSHLLPPLSGPAAMGPLAPVLPLVVASAGLVAFAAREFASFMRE
jgi:anti-sigma factor RsiW